MKNGHVPNSSWINIIEIGLKDDPDRIRQVLAFAIISSAVFTVISIVSEYPLPLDVSFCAFFYGYLLPVEHAISPLTRRLVLSYLILPVISGCFTWGIYRILIRGILFADAEEKFKRTLSWCSFLYPMTLATAATVISLKYFLSQYTPFYRIFYGISILFISFCLAYALFKVFLRAWIKRRVFLMYPQEYAVYMERSEKVEQSDREARGLGPIQDYYLPKITIGSPPSKDTNSTILQSGIMVPSLSPAVIAGKLALISKRSEELFRPIVNIISLVTLFTFTSFESRNVFIIVNRALEISHSQDHSVILFWSALLFILPGGLILSRRYAVFLGRNIINDMRFSQAFAIQLGSLLTITLGLFLHSIPLAPMWYILFSIAAVCSIQDDTPMAIIYSDSEESFVTFRQKIGYLFFLWTCSIIFNASIGFILRVIFNKI